MRPRLQRIAKLEARHEASEEVNLRLMRRITSDMDEPLKSFLNGVWRDVWIEAYLTFVTRDQKAGKPCRSRLIS